MWNCIKDNLILIMDDNVPSKISSSKYFYPWITKQTKRLIRNKNIWFQKAKQRKTDKSWNKYKDYKKFVQKQESPR